MKDLLIEVRQCKGLLFVGDPHLTTKKPARRLDKDFLGTIIEALHYIRGLALQYDLDVVILGDLFHLPTEMKPRLLGEVFDWLAGFERPPICLAGNHDLSETRLSPDTTLAVVAKTRLLKVVSTNELQVIYRMPGDQWVALGSTPYGMTIPDDVREPVRAGVAQAGGEKCDRTFWITHEDLDFPGAYPGAKVMHEIQGCDWVVNGHMHEAQDIREVGQTHWFNPGNITRMTRDQAYQQPTVWAWTPGGDWVSHIIPHSNAVETFDFSDKTVGASDASGAVASLVEGGRFADLVRDDIEDASRTDDGGLIQEDIEALLSERNVAEGVRHFFDYLAKSAIHGE